MNTELILFFLLAFIAVASGVAMLATKNAVYSALFLILNFSTIAVFYLMLSAPFIAMAQITIYAGAIMVLFLFVIMLLGSQEVSKRPTYRWQAPLAIFLGVLLLGEAAYVIITGTGVSAPPPIEAPGSLGSPQAIGIDLFSSYLLPFEVTSIVLLVAMIGAILLTQIERRKTQTQKQVKAEREIPGEKEISQEPVALRE